MLTACAQAKFNVNDPLCKAVLINPDSPDANYTDVYEQFDNALLLFILGAAVTFVSLLLKILLRIQQLATGLVIGGLISLASIIFMHSFRFDPDGNFCSGDLYPDTASDAPLRLTGWFIKTFIWGMWIFFGFIAVSCCGICAIGVMYAK